MRDVAELVGDPTTATTLNAEDMKCSSMMPNYRRPPFALCRAEPCSAAFAFVESSHARLLQIRTGN
ncbi:protein of unknown function [Stenotrophomonas maltophilia]|nr:protein of unknown function [Stenotrophomonas maltophilia]